jgi:hypothetical protein
MPREEVARIGVN